jgi:hypothetical protein
MQKGDIIKEICGHLLDGNKVLSSQVAKEKYPFANYLADKRKYSTVQMTKLFIRDGFIDRYSGDRLLFPGIFRILKIELPEEFPAHSNWKMTETHMVYWELFPTIDHIFPIARGGKDIEENLITTSMIRNSAKANWTLEEIGWTIKERGSLDNWDGLTSMFLDLVKKNTHLRNDNYIRKWEISLLKALD